MKSNFYEKRTREGLGEDVRTRRDATRRGGRKGRFEKSHGF